MEEQELARTLRENSEDPLLLRFDRQAKKVLQLDQVTAWILKYIIAEFRELSREEIMERLFPPEPLRVGREDGDAAVLYDSKRRVRLQSGEEAECFFFVNFEPHGRFHPGYPLPLITGAA